ncbi:toxin secretion/phage lysis holin [Evansella caseinilytica]|uniref:Toxin secretion/phage lysis holin n=1 Tax=Evansella caseinilytica TaxID=1503961 RepID=A0A1H3TN17_9BACI|nr:phage holin family protein [Evansella caseinilytica]SDZ51278.1 toxin secretion/phage lysis holin [Evansella caseinilytica]
MERIDIIFKAATSFIGFVISAMVGGLGLAFTVLVAMMVIDFVTGIMAGTKEEGVSSEVGIRGLLKKIYIILLISAVYLLQQVVEIAQFAGDAITITFIVLEFISIVENGGRLGVPLPQKLKDGMKILKGNNQ